MNDLEKLGLILDKNSKSQDKKLDDIAKCIKNQKPPIVNIPESVINYIPPEINIDVPDANIKVDVPEIKTDKIEEAIKEGFKKLEFPAPVVNIPKQDAPIINVPETVVNIKPPKIEVKPTDVIFPKEIEVKGMKELLKNTTKNEEIEEDKILSVKVIDKNGRQITDFGGDMMSPSVVGLKDTSKNNINPAKEDGNLASIKTQTDKLTFTGNKLQVDAVIETGDIEIGAVEIKNATDDTRATVGANGLYVDVRASALPTGAATEAKQDDIISAVNNKEIIGNASADGSGLTYYAVVDSAGRLQTRSFRDATGDGRRMLVDADRHGQVDVLSSSLPTGAATLAQQDKLAKYRAADVDADASPNYYGFVDLSGNWFILKETISAGADTYRYIAGTSNYTTNWTGRAGLSYDYLYNITIA